MTPGIIVCIQSDPMETHRPVEGLRIALGLSTGSTALTIVLLGRARAMLTDEADNAVDAEILERHLPVVRDLRLDIVMPSGSSEEFALDGTFAVREEPAPVLAALVLHVGRSLVF